MSQGPVLDVLRRELRRVSPNAASDIKAVLLSEVLERDLLTSSTHSQQRKPTLLPAVLRARLLSASQASAAPLCE